MNVLLPEASFRAKESKRARICHATFVVMSDRCSRGLQILCERKGIKVVKYGGEAGVLASVEALEKKIFPKAQSWAGELARSLFRYKRAFILSEQQVCLCRRLF